MSAKVSLITSLKDYKLAYVRETFSIRISFSLPTIKVLEIYCPNKLPGKTPI